jgi:ATP-dependent exoDNAse (exonuclease V) beta subunit
VRGDDALRLARVEQVLAAARAQHRRVPLKRLVEGAWLALGGPACARDQEDIADARAYFAFLDEHDAAGDLDDPASLDELMEELYAPEAPDADQRVQVLTMHKAKGLEFDTVILPGLQRGSGKDQTTLLRWLDRPQAQDGHEPDLMMAALAATGAERDPIYAYVGDLAAQQRKAEQLRQLYVATTRSKRRLHLIGAVTLAKEGVKLPRTGSLLRAMWAAVGDRFEAAAVGATAPEPKPEPGMPVQRFRRLPAAWRPPAIPGPVAALPPSEAGPDGDYIPFDWVGQTTRVVGIVVHRLLQRIAEDGLEHYAEPLLDWDPIAPSPAQRERAEVRGDPRVEAKRATRIASLWPAAEALLVREGLAEAERPQAMALVKEAIVNTLSDATGRWILSPHPDASSEREVSGFRSGRVVSVRFDRQFRAGHGAWIVDFKVSTIAGSGVGGFLDTQAERYNHQMASYRSLQPEVDARSTRTGLYFPALGAWRLVE